MRPAVIPERRVIPAARTRTTNSGIVKFRHRQNREKARAHTRNSCVGSVDQSSRDPGHRYRCGDAAILLGDRRLAQQIVWVNCPQWRLAGLYGSEQPIVQRHVNLVRAPAGPDTGRGASRELVLASLLSGQEPRAARLEELRARFKPLATRSARICRKAIPGRGPS